MNVRHESVIDVRRNQLPPQLCSVWAQLKLDLSLGRRLTWREFVGAHKMCHPVPRYARVGLGVRAVRAASRDRSGVRTRAGRGDHADRYCQCESSHDFSPPSPGENDHPGVPLRSAQYAPTQHAPCQRLLTERSDNSFGITRDWNRDVRRHLRGRLRRNASQTPRADRSRSSQTAVTMMQPVTISCTQLARPSCEQPI